MTTGSCLCGAVRFEIAGPLGAIQICHCTMCRKAQGSAFGANIPVQEQHFAFKSGQDVLSVYESSAGKQRIFCGRCGSPILSKTTALPGVVRVRAGTLDGPLASKPASHQFTAHKADWFEITDNLPQFAERPPAKA